MPGSREFALWVANSLGIEIVAAAGTYRMSMESAVRPNSGIWRYSVTLRFDPGRRPDPFTLIVRHGKAMGRERSTERTFPSMLEALKEARRKIIRQQGKGYSVVRIEANHPLRSWLDQLKVNQRQAYFPLLFEDVDDAYLWIENDVP